MSSDMNSSTIYFDEEWFLNEFAAHFIKNPTTSFRDVYYDHYEKYFPNFDKADAVRDKYYPNHYEKIFMGYRPHRMDLFDILQEKAGEMYVKVHNLTMYK